MKEEKSLNENWKEKRVAVWEKYRYEIVLISFWAMVVLFLLAKFRVI